jgi:hypothetical protein
MSGLFLGVGGSVGTLIGFRLYDVLVSKELIWAVLGTIGFATLPGYAYLLKIQNKTGMKEGKVVDSVSRDEKQRTQLVRIRT